MGKGTFWAIVVFLIVVVGGICIVKYNGLATADEQVTKSWTPLGGELKKRYASIPRLIPEVDLYVGTNVVEAANLATAHTRFLEATTFSGQVEAANDVEEAIQKLGQYMQERYPVIEQQHQFDVIRDLMQGTGQTMGPMIQKYNHAVDGYDTYARRFPANLVALALGFPSNYEYFQQEQ